MAIVIKGVKFDTMDEVSKAIEMGVIEKHDVLDSSPHIQPAHGLWHDANLGGLFSGAGAESDVFHTVVRPTSTGFLSQLMRGTTTIQNPLYDVLSGVRALSGTPAADACSQAPKAGEAISPISRLLQKLCADTQMGLFAVPAFSIHVSLPSVSPTNMSKSLSPSRSANTGLPPPS